MKQRSASVSPRTAAARSPASIERDAKLYGMLLDAIPCSVLLFDRGMRVISVNRNFLQKSNRSESATLGRRLTEVFPPVILQQMQVAERIPEVFDRNAPTKGQRLAYRAPGLPMRVYYYSILPFSQEGVVESAMLLMEDVTEQARLGEDMRRAERHLASVVESASDMVLSTDTEGRILTWNNAAEKLSGCPFQEAKDRFFFDFCAEQHREEIKGVFASMAALRDPTPAEWTLVKKSGALVTVTWVCSPMTDDLSRPTGAVLVGRDLSLQRELEAQLRQSQKLAALGVMAGGIAHEVRNPLAICSSAAQFLLEDETAPGFHRECAEKIQNATLRASGIIENLLRFARPSAKIDMEQVDICSVLSNAVALVANEARMANIELRTEFADGPPVLINGNADLLTQVFLNLALNGIKAMPDGGTLTLVLRRTGIEALIEVTDTGCGISPADLESIFDPFFTTSPVGRGTGLGLSLCYAIVKQHFGAIEVNSVKGKGSTFTVRLPVS